MRIVIAEDDQVSRRVLQSTLVKWGHEVVVTSDGKAALDGLLAPDAPKLAILDWMMPQLDGIEVCRRLRAAPLAQPPYIVLLTARGDKRDLVAGLDAGADDYIAKPFDRGELQARINVGIRVVELQRKLAERILELEEALANVRQLQGLLPICAWCKKIRDDQNYWHQVETYIGAHSDARFSHGICPECLKIVMGKVDQASSGAVSAPPPGRQ
ncbi:MAG TPA: response regulator transcription factor [Gemmataceae bacterium]|nr:response regulator transcription factor [Gemmataceae bacterium]